MVESTPKLWSANILTNIVLFFSPKEAVETLKLREVSKNFRRAVKEVAPYQLEACNAVITELKPKV